jgi:hypothetical protein
MRFLLTSARLFARCGMFAVLAALVPQTSTAATCVAGPTTLCLNNQRFKLEVQWKDFEGKTGVGQAVPLTSDTGYFWFFNSNNVELVVKVLDGRPLNGKFWVFFGALSNVEYSMTVTDSVSGSVKTYSNPSGRFASVGDTSAFSVAGEPRSLQNADVRTTPVPNAVTTCVGTETSLCLNGSRFRVEVNWKDFDGNTGVGKAISLTSDTGYFWFFNSSNVELVVKVLDARGLNSKFWVFYGALSNVEYEMTVTDTLTGNVKTYSNPSGRFASAGDTDAFRAGYGVTARLDDSRAVSKDIPTTGGTISATAADGTLFTLTLPPDALLSPETITMTPVTAIDGLPLSGGLAGAVDLAPAGLRLFNAATLTIAPPAAIPTADQITFGWRGNGDEFFFYPPQLGTSNISMKLMHFSGYGVGRGTAADQSAQQQRIPADPEDALSQRLQNIIAVARRAQSVGIRPLDDSDIIAKIATEMFDYYRTVLVPDLATAKTDCSKAKGIMQRALAWARQAQLLGLFDDEVQNIMSTLTDALVNCYNESFDKCVSKHDPAQISPMLGYARQLALLGASDRIEENKMQRCAHFDLDFESVIDELQPKGAAFKWRHQVKATVPLTFSFETGPTGNGELVYSSVTYTGPSVSPCSQNTVGTNSVFQVIKTQIDLNVYEGNSPPPQPLTMEYDPGYPNFTFTMTCPMSPKIELMQERWRTEYYDHHHEGERFGSGFLAKDWARVGGGVYARRTWQITSPFATETTIMNLKHTPQ